MLGRLLRREERAVTYQSLWMNDDWPQSTSWSGQSITQAKATQIGAVYAAIRLYADTISTFPVGVFTRRDGARLESTRPQWTRRPLPSTPWSRHIQQGMLSLLVNGNWYARVYRDAAGAVLALQVLDPTKVEPVQRNDGTVQYIYNGGEAILSTDDVIHITELVPPGSIKGLSRIDQVKQELGLAQALTEFAARFFANGTSLSGVIEVPAVLTPEQATQALETFESSHRGTNQHRPALLGGGGAWKQTSVAPDEAQMLESRTQAVETVARVFKIPPHKLGITTPGAMSYSSVEQLQIAWVQDSLQPYVSLIEDAYGDLLPRQDFLRLNMDALLRGDSATRFAGYAQAIDAGWMSINDVHRFEDMPPVDGGDVYRVGLENIDLGAANTVATQKNVDMAVALIGAGADPAQTLAAFGLPSIVFQEVQGNG